MSNDIHKALNEWWNTISFDGKELYALTENGELVLQAIAAHPARTIANFSAEDKSAQFNTLIEKYREASVKVSELETEWLAGDDKLKLAGKVEKLKEYILEVNAAGHMDKLLTTVDSWIHALEQLAETNYNIKLKLAEAAESFAVSENWKETTQAFKDITEQWKQTGNIDRRRSDQLWERIETARTKFFERKRQHQESNEKDLLQNLDLKMEIAEKAEQLALSEKWKETTEAFKQLMEQWKSIGHTIPEKNEELWQRLITAKNQFFDRKKVHTDDIQQELERNVIAKTALVDKAEALKDSTDWTATTQAFADILEEWKNTGRAVAEKADELWGRMKVAREHFFNAKHQYFESRRENLQANYIKKKELLERAEALQNSTHWHDATTEMNALMEEWKKTGPVPREHSNKIWEAFLAARKAFFKRKDENRERRKEHSERKKAAHLHQVKDLLKKLAQEIREEEERITDFKNGLQNIGTGKKEKELGAHLQTLIAEGEEKIKRKLAKTEQAKKELAELDAKLNPSSKDKE